MYYTRAVYIQQYATAVKNLLFWLRLAVYHVVVSTFERRLLKTIL